MVEKVGSSYTDEQRFWIEFEEALKDAWMIDPPKQIMRLPEPIYSVKWQRADIYDPCY